MNIKKTHRLGQHIGIIGGGQLAKMTALSALKLGCDISLMECEATGVATALANYHFIGDWNNADDLISFAKHVDVVTLEHEFVDANSLHQLEQAGYTLFPSSESIRLIQDKLVQKQTLYEAGLPLAAYTIVESRQHIADIAKEFDWPLVIKTRRNGYDGKGNVTVNNASEVGDAWDKLNGDEWPLYAEAFCPFISELAIIITTGQQGEMATYPLVSSVQNNHICRIIRVPASVSAKIAANATDIAHQAVAAIGAVGSFGVEMFLMQDGEIMINELAPRVHNSGHYTIEACECSQFENHVRALMGWPLGSTKMLNPAAVMVNLLGQSHGSGQVSGLDKALTVAGAQIHIYGKDPSTPGRKMGHVTAVGNNVSEAEQVAQAAADLIYFGVKK